MKKRKSNFTHIYTPVHVGELVYDTWLHRESPCHTWVVSVRKPHTEMLCIDIKTKEKTTATIHMSGLIPIQRMLDRRIP